MEDSSEEVGDLESEGVEMFRWWGMIVFDGSCALVVSVR